MKRGKKGSRSNETNFFSFFFLFSLFHHCFEQFESDPFFFLREGGVVCRVSGTGVRGWRFGIQGNVVRSSATTDRHRGNIPTRSQLRPFADYKENHSPQALARFCCESKHAFLLFYQLRTTGPYV